MPSHFWFNTHWPPVALGCCWQCAKLLAYNKGGRHCNYSKLYQSQCLNWYSVVNLPLLCPFFSLNEWEMPICILYCHLNKRIAEYNRFWREIRRNKSAAKVEGTANVCDVLVTKSTQYTHFVVVPKQDRQYLYNVTLWYVASLQWIHILCWDTHYCLLCNSIEGFTEIFYGKFYVAGKNETYVHFHVKCMRIPMRTHIVADEAGNFFSSSLCRQVTSQM
jgi:hypothetical protein